MLLQQQITEVPVTFLSSRKRMGWLGVTVPGIYDDEMRQLPGVFFESQDLGDLTFAMPRTWNSLLSLKSLANKVQWSLRPDSEVRAWANQQARAWKQLTEAAQIVRKGPKREDVHWYLHQEDGAHWLNCAPETGVGRILQDEMGTGKTGTIIKALLDAKAAGPILVVALESALDQAWAKDIGQWAGHYRTVQVTGTYPQRRKQLEALKAGEYDVAIIGQSNFRTMTRHEAFGNSGLKRCIACGGPRLTRGLTDKDGKVLPDIDFHHEVKIHQVERSVEVEDGWKLVKRYVGSCAHGTCAWYSEDFVYPLDAAREIGAHSRTGRKVREITAAQCQRHMKELNEIEWQYVIIDEIHRATNASSQFAHAMWGVTHFNGTGVTVPPERRWGLTGTPISKTSEQAWAPLHWIGPTNWPTKSSWVDYFCVESENWAGFRTIEKIKPEREAEFHATYSAVTRRVLAEQVLDLPPVLRWGSLERQLTMGKAQREQYLEMKQQMLLAVESGMITADNAAQQAGRLSMLATGCGAPHPGNVPGGPRKMILLPPSCKLDAIIEDFQSGMFDDGQIGMMFNSAQALHMIREQLITKKVLKGPDIAVIAGTLSKAEVDIAIRNFQAGKRKVVMLTYAKGGASITLTAAKYVLAVERSWNPIDNQQGVKRFHRIGSEIHDHVTVLDYVVQGTNEIRQLTRLDEKAETIDQITRDRARLKEWFA